VDASLVLLWLLPEELSGLATALRERWLAEGAELIAPYLLPVEVPSALRQAVYRGRITEDEGQEAFEVFLDMEIRIIQPDRLLARTWEIGRATNAPRLYDIFYVTLAEMQGCQLWTADKRLVNQLEIRYPWVRWVGELGS
jgi:predicted nucleic acid-binding protein